MEQDEAAAVDRGAAEKAAPSTLGGFVLWGAAAAALLALGFGLAMSAGLVAMLGSGALDDPDLATTTRTGFAVYFLVILLEGLIPQIVLVLMAWPLVTRRFPECHKSWRGLAFAVIPLASIAAVLATHGVLAIPKDPLPHVAIRGAANHIATYFFMTTATSAALLLARRVIPTLRPAA